MLESIDVSLNVFVFYSDVGWSQFGRKLLAFVLNVYVDFIKICLKCIIVFF